MKHLFYCFACLLLTAETALAAERDSAKAAGYFRKAMKQELYAPIRQRYLDSALLLEPANAYFWQQKAMPLYKQHKYEAGTPYLDSAVKYDPQQYLPYRAFMKCIFQKAYRDAIVDLQAAKKMDSVVYIMDHPFDFYLSLCYLQLNELDVAKRYIRKTIDDRRRKYGSDLDHYLHFFYYGVVQLEQEDYRAAIKSFDVALAIYPRLSDAKYYKAKCYAGLQQPQQASALYREAFTDIEEGYTLAEDNVIYEPYPYQIKKSWVKALTNQVSEKQ